MLIIFVVFSVFADYKMTALSLPISISTFILFALLLQQTGAFVMKKNGGKCGVCGDPYHVKVQHHA